MPVTGPTDFDARARDYETGPRAAFHAVVVDRSADVALGVVQLPLRVLDVGCGTGALLRQLNSRLPNVLELIGADPAPEMLRIAAERAEGIERFVHAEAEQLPFPDSYFDLVVSTSSFDHWRDQARGLAEAARVLAPGGRLVLADLCAAWLSGSRESGRARTLGRVRALMEQAGLRVERVEVIYRVAGLPLVRAFTAARA